MTALRFLHTADIHLGKPFGGYPSGERLRVARRGVITRLIEAARQNSAPHILVAGDLFDAANPAAETWRQAAAEMAEASDLIWWLLPGNHDSLSARDGAAATWEAMAALGHRTLRILTEPKPVEMQPGAWLLPAPLTTRRPSSDPTAWMDSAATPEGALRIGLAHGPIQGFGEGDMPADIIAPDRDRRARLDWLALGDWHGAMRVSDRTAYAGSPERTGFGHAGRGTCLLVDIAAPDTAPKVDALETGTFDWQTLKLDFVPGDDPEQALAEALPQGARRDMLVKLEATGRLPLQDASTLAVLETQIVPEFCHFETAMDSLATEVETADLDAISLGGALREAANALAESSTDGTLSQDDQRVSEAALRRLHAIVQELGR